jgi:hypothetical protein
LFICVGNERCREVAGRDLAGQIKEMRNLNASGHFGVPAGIKFHWQNF